MIDISKLDFSKLNVVWGTIAAAIAGGWFVVVGGIAGSTARNGMKLLGIGLVSLLTVGMIGGIFYASGVIPIPPSVTVTTIPIVFQAQPKTRSPFIVRSSPFLAAPTVHIVPSSANILVYAQLEGQQVGNSYTWYLVEIKFNDTEFFGYISSTVVDLNLQPNQPNATPPVVTLTPTMRP